jgi:hypothetical protein
MMLSLTDMAVTLEEAAAYAESRGLFDWFDDAAALRRGQDYVAGKYNHRWTEVFENDDAPDAVKYAIVEAARIELATPGSLTPALDRGGQVKRLKVRVEGAVERETEWADSAPVQQVVTAIDNLLKAAGLIRSGVNWLARV